MLYTFIIISAFSISDFVRAIPICSIVSSVVRSPAVSDKFTMYPPMSKLVDTTSRVVPGIFDTIARFDPTIALNNDDLPTFVSPANTTLKPLRMARTAV